MQKARIKNGKRQVLCGGYVSYFVGERRHEKEFRVWMPAGRDYADCGYAINKLVAAIESAAKKRTKRAITVSECWQY